jgi:hypothetical protein
MATTKKHIAVYLDPAVQQALSEFCEQRGLKSKKGVVFSAGVNTALAEFFGISETEEGSTPVEDSSIPNNPKSNTPINPGSIPSKVSSIPTESGNIPTTSLGSIPVQTISNIPVESLVVGELPGKFQA